MRIRAMVESGLEYGGVKKLERKPGIAKGTRNGYRESLYDFIASLSQTPDISGATDVRTCQPRNTWGRNELARRKTTDPTTRHFPGGTPSSTLLGHQYSIARHGAALR
jgi:hypothetical protein